MSLYIAWEWLEIYSRVNSRTFYFLKGACKSVNLFCVYECIHMGKCVLGKKKVITLTCNAYMKIV